MIAQLPPWKNLAGSGSIRLFLRFLSRFPPPRDRPRGCRTKKVYGLQSAAVEQEPPEEDGESTIVSRTSSPTPASPSTALFSTRSTRLDVRVYVRVTWPGWLAWWWWCQWRIHSRSRSIERVGLAVSIFHDKLVTVSRVKEKPDRPRGGGGRRIVSSFSALPSIFFFSIWTKGKTTQTRRTYRRIHGWDFHPLLGSEICKKKIKLFDLSIFLTTLQSASRVGLNTKQCVLSHNYDAILFPLHRWWTFNRD